VEKPLALSVQEGEELIQLAQERKRILMVGHLLLYHPAILKLKEYVEKGEIGDLYYLYSTRVNLGKVRREENALWSFAPHDLSVALSFFGTLPSRVSATGESYLREGIFDVVFVSLHFPKKKMAHIHVSWLDPHKIRKITLVGSKKMVVFDDMESTEKIRLYDKGVDYQPAFASFSESLTLRVGDVHIPRVNAKEPLKEECKHFIECVIERKNPLTDGENGLQVLRVLDAAQKSLEQGGKPINL
jgi:predicted dehydrogenase